MNAKEVAINVLTIAIAVSLALVIHEKVTKPMLKIA